MYLIEKLPSEKYAFSLINTGGGINQFHQSQDIGLKTKYKPLVRITDIEEHLMTNTSFIEALQELSLFVDEKNDPVEHEASDLYEKKLPALQGKRDTEFENSMISITAQRSGTCSWKSLMKLLFLESDPNSKDYKHFIFNLKKDSLESFFYKMLSDPSLVTDENIQLVQRSTKTFSNAVNTLKKAEVINETELKEAKELVQKILNKIEEYDSQQVLEPVSLDQLPEPSQGEQLPRDLFETPIQKTQGISKMHKSFAAHPIAKEFEFPDNLKELNASLGKLENVCKKLLTKNMPRSSISTITEAFANLKSLGLEHNEYWERVCKNESTEIVKTMSTIQQLSMHLVESIAQIPQSERGSPQHFVILAALLAINVRWTPNVGQDSRTI